jgi:hypothetical protein
VLPRSRESQNNCVNSLSYFIKNEKKKAGIKVRLEKHYTSPTSIINPPMMTEVNVVVCTRLRSANQPPKAAVEGLGSKRVGGIVSSATENRQVLGRRTLL